MIREVLLRELRASGRYREIHSLHSDVHGDFVLRGHLFDLRELDGKVLAARVTFEFELRDSRTGTAVWRRYYSHDEPVEGKNVPAVVAALNRNVVSGLSDLRDGLEQYFSTHSAVASSGPH
jgi:ABC-type uncharacterized transport system auxiliary subunit